MTGFAALILGLAQLACPPDVGQIKWMDFEFGFQADGARYQVTASVWDRDRDGRISGKDLVRVDDATRNGDSMGVSDAWFQVGGKLAKGMEGKRKRLQALRAACESRFDVKGVPKITTPGKLAKSLNAWGGVVRQSPTERLEADMEGWASELCKEGQHMEQSELANRLAAKAAHRHGKIAQRRRQAIAHEVAKRWAMQCAHLKVPPKLTFE
ncbi:MAG: hypothetical protein H6702_07165 [Myxococcales bacterium]|nr:hypothetical protein [Myxococcales bacterium]